MIAAPFGIDGEKVIIPFSRMAQGKNILHEHNKRLGQFNHPHGWGAIYEEGGKLRACRRLAPFWDDPEIARLRGKKVFLLHARRASRGEITGANVHPFTATHEGKTFYFCHNGTIDDPVLDAYSSESDSERYFHYLLSRFDCSRPVESLKEATEAICNYTSLNAFLLSETLFCVINRYLKSPRYYTLYKAEGPIISSEPLLELSSDWAPLGNGTVLCLERAAG